MRVAIVGFPTFLVSAAISAAILITIIAFGVRWGLSMWWNTRCYHLWDLNGTNTVLCRHCGKRQLASKVRSQLARQAAAAAPTKTGPSPR